jgi:hypothetical protein
MVMHHIVMPANRFRPNMIHIYLHPKEDKFIKDYAKRNFLTVSELIRGWFHEVMKRDGYDINEPLMPESSKTKKGVKK